MTTARAFSLIDEIASVAKPVLVLSGGEPLFRSDIFDIAEYGVRTGLRMALATNGTLVTERVAAKIAATGFSRVAISLDGANPDTHDRFRGMPGAHGKALAGLRYLRAEGVSVQINSTVAKHNVSELPALLDLALTIGADALHLFMLVPVGCGLEIAPAEMLPADEYERVLHWFDDQAQTCPIDLKATCAPHYYRDPRAAARGGTAPRQFRRHLHCARHQGEGGPHLYDGASRPRRPAAIGDDARLSGRDQRVLHLEPG